MIVIVNQRILEKHDVLQEIIMSLFLLNGLFHLRVDSDVIYIFLISALILKDINSQLLYYKENIIYRNILLVFDNMFFKLNIIKYMVFNIKSYNIIILMNRKLYVVV